MEPAGTFKLKFPSTSVTVPVLVPATLIDAPITGSPSSEATTLPVTDVWAKATPQLRIAPYLIEGIANLVSLCGINSDFVGALPTALMKPLSGSGARGLMVDAMNTYGADSFVGRLSCIFQGSTGTVCLSPTSQPQSSLPS